MGFEFVPSGEWKAGPRLESGFAALGRDARLTLHAEDLRLVGIFDEAAVCADPDTLRIGLRVPTEAERPRARRVGVVKAARHGRDTGRRTIDVRKALQRIRLDPRQVNGRYEVSVKGEGLGGILIVHIGDCEKIAPSELADLRDAGESARARHAGEKRRD
jgi:hypothetical protein